MFSSAIHTIQVSIRWLHLVHNLYTQKKLSKMAIVTITYVEEGNAFQLL